MKPILFLCLILIADLCSADEIRPFSATYQISRGGDLTGQQTTVLTKKGHNQWSLVDSIIGTKGLASFIGFERTELTEFTYSPNGLIATKHQMQQKAAFSKKNYQFELNPNNNQYTVNNKNHNTLLLPQQNAVLSSQLLPIAIAVAACNEQTSINLTVLKNDSTSPYHFNVTKEPSFQAARIYPENSSKQTISWLDPNKQCLPTKNIHAVKGEPTIETTLTEFEWLK